MYHNTKLVNKNFLIPLLVAAISLFGSNLALAVNVPDLKENIEFRNSAIKHAEMALMHAKQKHANETIEHSKLASDSAREINSEMWSSKLSKATTRLRIAGSVAKKGNFDKSITLLEEAIANLKSLKN